MGYVFECLSSISKSHCLTHNTVLVYLYIYHHPPTTQILAHAQQMMSRKGRSIKDVVEVLKVFRDNVDESEAPSSASVSGSVTNSSTTATTAEQNPAAVLVEDASPPQREILGGLIGFLEGVP